MADPPPVAPGELPRPQPPPTWSDLARRALSALGARRALALLAALAVVATAVVGCYLALRTPAPPPTELLLPYAGTRDPGGAAVDEAVPAGGPSAGTAASTTSSTVADLLVHAAGAVAVPGVHRVPAGSRVADLLTAAGGAAVDADLDRVNLAAALADGERVWFPRVGEPEVPPVAAPSGGAGATDEGGEPAGPVDLNTATAEQLETLPGIGPATAASILEHRQRNGPFRSVDDLLDVPGIGEAKLAQLRELVTV